MGFLSRENPLTRQPIIQTFQRKPGFHKRVLRRKRKRKGKGEEKQKNKRREEMGKRRRRGREGS